MEDEPTLHQPAQRPPIPILNFKNTQKIRRLRTPEGYLFYHKERMRQSSS